ncbi:MAG: DUF1800 domain-containing protein [Verrucomicrobiota bacterium]
MLEPINPKQWDYRLAAHLLNRAGFGGPPDEIERLAKIGFDKAISYFVDFDRVSDPTPAPAWAKAESEEQWEQRSAARRAADPKQRSQIDAMRRSQERKNLSDLLGWWLKRMANGSRPLQEKLTLFWHDHFATSYEKLENAYLMWLQNETFRRNAAGNWTRMLEEITVDPAMLVWLDQHTSNKRHPNENYAREVMELFSLGEGNYTERDVVETARALTGLALDKTRQNYVYKPEIHDEGAKTVLGKTGNLDWQDVLKLIQLQPQSQRFIAGKLWTWFAGVPPSRELTDALAEELRRSANHFQPMLKVLFSSQEFYSPEVLAAQVKSPVQWLVGTCRVLGRELPPPDTCDSMLTSLGQRLFFPPDVNGWVDGPDWITTNNLLDRYNLVERLILGDPGRKITPAPVAKLFTRAELADKAAFLAALERRFFLVPLEDSQKKTLFDFLAARRALDDATVQQTIRLALSTPQYQLT